MCSAMELIARAGGETVVGPWSLGGGTALMLQIQHRQSYDIDIFLDDPQVLGLLNPLLNDYSVATRPSDYDTDGRRMLKLFYPGLGEIDFICCAHLTERPVMDRELLGKRISLETPGEIIAKKIHYRGAMIQHRDLFDIAAVLRQCGQAELTETLKLLRADCIVALDAVRRMDAAFAAKGMRQLMLEPDFAELPDLAQTIVMGFLEDVISSG